MEAPKIIIADDPADQGNIANTNLSIRHEPSDNNIQADESITPRSPAVEPVGQAFFDRLFSHKVRKYPNNTLVSMTLSPESTTDSFAMSIPVDVNYSLTVSETIKSREDHEFFREEFRNSVGEHDEHQGVFPSQNTTADQSCSSRSEKLEESREIAETTCTSRPVAGSSVSPPTDNDTSDEDELTSGGEEDIMAQFGSGKNVAEFEDLVGEEPEGARDSRDEKVFRPAQWP